MDGAAAGGGGGGGGEPPRPLEVGDEEDIDELNDETFGSGAVEGDWEAAHLSSLLNLHSESREIAGHHHASAVNTTSLPSAVPDTTSSTSKSDIDNPIPGFAQKLNIKDLWPSSPEKSTTLDTIWSPQGLPPAPPSQPQTSMVSPSHGTPPRARMMTVEDLERQLLDSSSSSSPAPPLPSSSPNLPQPLQQLMPQAMPVPPSLTPPLGSSPQHHPPPTHFHRMPLLSGPPKVPLLPQQQRPFPPDFKSYPPPAMMVHHRFPLHHLPPNISMRGPPRMIHNFYPPAPPHIPPQPLPPHLHYHYQHQHHQHQQQQRQQAPPHSSRPSPPPSKRSELLCDLQPDGSGFMSKKEKEWVVKVQLLQLQSSNPEVDDYYYQRFMSRETARLGKSEGVVSGRNDQATLPATQIPVEKDREERVYHPAEFKGTLGKISVSTLTAPKKSIDVGTRSGAELEKREESRWKVVMVTIEEIYSILLKLEEAEERDALAVLDEEEKEKRSGRKRALLAQAFSLLQLGGPVQEKEDEQFFVQLMTHRKGKKVIERLLPFLSDTHAQAVVLAVLRNLYSIIRKDSSDKVLPLVAPSVCAVVTRLALSQITTLLSFLCPTETRIAAKIVINEFYSTVASALLKRGCVLVTNESNSQYIETWQACTLRLYNLVSSIAKMENSPLVSLLSTLPHLTT